MGLLVRRAALCVCAASLSFMPAVNASPSTRAAARPVTLDLYGRGKARWTFAGGREKGRLALDYRWYGRLRFRVPAAALEQPKHRGLDVRSVAMLVASWVGHSRRTLLGQTSTCRYRGFHVRARVTARLARGRNRNTLELILHPRPRRRGFFSDRGRRATVRCTSSWGAQRPSHFAPSWFFRDNLQDHGRMTVDTAVIVLPGTLLTHRSATIAFPRERGVNDSGALGRLAWNNRGETAVHVR